MKTSTPTNSPSPTSDRRALAIDCAGIGPLATVEQIAIPGPKVWRAGRRPRPRTASKVTIRVKSGQISFKKQMSEAEAVKTCRRSLRREFGSDLIANCAVLRYDGCELPSIVAFTGKDESLPEEAADSLDTLSEIAAEECVVE